MNEETKTSNYMSLFADASIQTKYTFSNEYLIGIKQAITAFDNHFLYGQIASYILCGAYFIVHSLLISSQNLIIEYSDKFEN